MKKDATATGASHDDTLQLIATLPAGLVGEIRTAARVRNISTDALLCQILPDMVKPDNLSAMVYVECEHCGQAIPECYCAAPPAGATPEQLASFWNSHRTGHRGTCSWVLNRLNQAPAKLAWV